MDTVLIDGIEYNFPAIEKDCWLRLLNGSLKSKDPLHNPVVANRNGQGINIRTVVLRNTDIQKKQLVFHTDIRSGKWKELQEDAAISWLFYNPVARVQIRLSGAAILHHDDCEADEAWGKSIPNSRKIYMGDDAVSAIKNMPVSGVPEKFETLNPTIAESEAGRKNFGTVTTQVQWMEWLWLNSAGHRRASFRYNAQGIFVASWLVP